jgi:RHS repeat-associated protein
VHAEYLASSNQWNEYLTAGSVMVGVRFNNFSTVTTRYFHTDHLGSVSVITDETGIVKEQLSYDAWGKRRYANGQDDPNDLITSVTTRGFTDQEELSIAGLVHLNGRIYDTLVGRMMSADPTVPNPLDQQTYNRYSYVSNDPLTFTDPSGFTFLSNFFNDIGAFVRDLFQIIIVAILTPVFPAAPAFAAFVAAAASSALITGVSGGDLNAVIKNAVVAGATAVAFFGVGEATGGLPGFGTPNYIENVAGHAAVGCVSAVASGGKCGAGALSAATGAAATPLVADVFGNPQGNAAARVEGATATGIIGGFASVLGGGKFEDGAVTAAFGYLFNAGGLHKPTPEEWAAGQQQYLQAMGGLGMVGVFLFGGEIIVAADLLIDGGIALTGTVWDAITGTQAVYEGTVIPRSFILATEGADVWVAPNATEHMAEYALGMLDKGVSADLVNMGTQAQLTSLQAAVGAATSNGVTYGTIINEGGWQLMFSPAREADQLPALIHALPR